MFDRIQNIGTINGSNNLIINGDVVANGEILTAIANQLLRQDFERVSQEAREEMQACANECVQKVLEQVLEKKIQSPDYNIVTRLREAHKSMKGDHKDERFLEGCQQHRVFF